MIIHTHTHTVSSEVWTLGTGTTGTLFSRPDRVPGVSSSSARPLTLSRRLTEAPMPAPNNKVAPVRSQRVILSAVPLSSDAL